MAKYMTQKMKSGVLTTINYYRKQKNAHPSHVETGAFTTAATAAYAQANGIAVGAVEVGKFMSDQGTPTGGTTQEI